MGRIVLWGRRPFACWWPCCPRHGGLTALGQVRLHGWGPKQQTVGVVVGWSSAGRRDREPLLKRGQ